MEFEEAKDKVMMGSERSMVLTRKKTNCLSWGWHAIVTINEKAYPIHKATIIPRGRALGMVMQLPERWSISNKGTIHAQMAIAMGGRVAEEIIFGDDKVTTGQLVTWTNHKKSKSYGDESRFSKELGPVAYGENEEKFSLEDLPRTKKYVWGNCKKSR